MTGKKARKYLTLFNTYVEPGIVVGTVKGQILDLVDIHTFWRVPLVATGGPGQGALEGMYEIEGRPRQDDDVVSVEPERHHCGRVTHTWNIKR